MITIAGFVIDAALRETHTYESEVTEYPVESGAMITDNIRPRPITIEIEGVVSNTPLPGPVATARGATNEDGELEHVPSDDALAALQAIYEAREPVTIGTSLKRYENMALTNLVIPRDADTGHALFFTASFQQVQYVTNDRATIKVAPPVSTGLGAKKDLGNKIVFGTGKDLIIWHHSEPAPAFSTSEVIGYKSADVLAGRPGFYHPDGRALTDAEVEQMNEDTRVWMQTHNEQGELTVNPAADPLGASGTSNKGTFFSRGREHSPEGVFSSSSGEWQDSEGHPVTYNSNFGGWLEKSPF